MNLNLQICLVLNVYRPLVCPLLESQLLCSGWLHTADQQKAFPTWPGKHQEAKRPDSAEQNVINLPFPLHHMFLRHLKFHVQSAIPKLMIVPGRYRSKWVLHWVLFFFSDSFRLLCFLKNIKMSLIPILFLLIVEWEGMPPPELCNWCDFHTLHCVNSLPGEQGCFFLWPGPAVFTPGANLAASVSNARGASLLKAKVGEGLGGCHSDFFLFVWFLPLPASLQCSRQFSKPQTATRAAPYSAWYVKMFRRIVLKAKFKAPSVSRSSSCS